MRPTVKLGEICDILDKKRKPITQKDRTKGIYPYYGASGILDYVADYIFDEDLVLIGEDGAKRGALDNSAFKVSGKVWVNNHAHVIRPHREKILDDFLVYFLVSSDLSDYITGTTVPKLNQERLKLIEIPLPPLETQKAIVAKLDQIFAELDQTKSEIQKNLDNTDELWKSALNQAFQGDWEMKKLGEVAEIGPKKAEISLDENTKVSFVPMSDLSQEEMLFQTKNENTISELRKGSYTYFKNDDVLLAKVTPCFENGKCGIAKNLTNGIGFGSSEFIVFRPKDFIKSEFLYYFVSNKAFREEGAKNMGGAVGLQRVKKDWIENHNIPVPPLSEQEKIVEHLDQVSKEVKALKSQYQSQLDNLEELKKSVLDKVFRGELE